jgi:serine protease inhibitor
MRLLSVPLAALAIGLLAAVGSAQPTPKSAPLSEATKTTVRASNDFACDLFHQLARAKPGKCVFVSPWSISSALAMTMEGARGETAEEMGKVLRIPADLRQAGARPWRLAPYHTGFAEMQRRCTVRRDPVKDDAARKKIAELRAELARLNERIQKSGGEELYPKAKKVADNINTLEQQLDPYELNIANAIWGDKTYPFDPKYVETIGGLYGTGLIRESEFINAFPAERKKINRWVEEQTKDRVKDLIPEIPEEQARLIRMILVNAIYFKGQWSDSFDKKWTKSEAFLNADGKNTKVELMQQTMPARYAAFNADGSFFETPRFTGFGAKEKTYPNDGGFQIAELPYKGGRLAMTVILPRTRTGLPAVEKMLDGPALTRWLSRLEARSVMVKLPRFRMDTEYELGDILQALGMNQAFAKRGADFTGMTTSSDPEDRLHISRVIHKAFVEVNEEGTEAAAATAVILGLTDSAVPEPFNPDFRADRPFLVLIREVDTGAVLFMGRVTTPGK